MPMGTLYLRYNHVNHKRNLRGNIMYYKIIQERNIIGVASENDFRRWQSRNGLIVVANADNAQFLEYAERYYYDDWFKALPEGCDIVRELCDIIRIEEEEYNEIKEQLDSGIVPQDDSLNEEIETVDDNQGDEDEPIVVKKTAAQILEEQIKLAARFAEV